MGIWKLLYILFGLNLALIGRLDGEAVAQGEIQILDSRVDIQFPDEVTFKLNARAPAAVESVFLTYGTNARSCQSGGSRQKVDFEPGSDVKAEWVWELKRSGSVPPGSRIWWIWTIEDADGNRFATERQELLVTDDRFSWRSLERDGLTVNWFSGDRAFAEQTLAAASDELARISAEIGVETSEPVQLWIYPTADDVREALVISADWTGAVAFPDYQIMIISLAPGQSEWAADVIPHELTHLVVGMITHNCRGGYLPVWLGEGLAVYSEEAIDEAAVERLETALQEQRLQPLRSLADGFSAYGSGAGMAYAQSGAVVRYLLGQYGPEQMDVLLSAVRDGLTIDRALEQVFGFDTDGLDAHWREAQGYAATPTSAAAASAANATPTAVPTLALVSPPVVSTPTATTASPTSTRQPSPTATETVITSEPSPTATSAAVAEIASATRYPESAPSPIVQPIGELSESDPSPLPWIAGIGLGVTAILAAGYFVLRKGE
jgi:hypothetical protein